MMVFVLGIVVRQIADLLTVIHDNHQSASSNPCLEVEYQESVKLQVNILIFNTFFA